MAPADRPENYEEEAAEVIETLRQLTWNIEPSPQLLPAVLAQGEQLLSPWRVFWRHWQQRIGAGLHRIEASPLWVLAPICLVLMMISSWQIQSQRSIQAALNEQRILLKTQQATLEGQQTLLQTNASYTYKMAWANLWLADAAKTLAAHGLLEKTNIDDEDKKDPKQIFERAVDYFLQAARMDSQEAGQNLYYAAIAYRDACQIDKARDILREAVHKEPGNIGAHYDLGVIYHLLGYYEKAIEEYKIVLSQGKYIGLIEQAAFNLAVVYTSYFKENSDTQQRAEYLHNVLLYLAKSIEIGGPIRLDKIIRAQQKDSHRKQECPAYDVTEDLSGITRESQFTEWLIEQRAKL